jgi:hypothetical protein
MTDTPTDRDRLLRAFAELNRHGILARPAFDGAAAEGHAALRAHLTARHPGALGSYVFWTEADERRFDATGDLTSALPLHVSGEEVATAVEAVCRAEGVALGVTGATAVVRAASGRRRPASVTARPAVGASSPWRWLGPRTAVAARRVEATP